MNEVGEFFNRLFDADQWPPRWQCGIWTDFHGWLYITSDLSIWLAYFIIPVIIILLIQKRPDIPFLPVFWLFGAFIVLCGMTHLLDAVIFWWPAYRLSAFVRFLTAIVSFVTVFALIRDVPKLFIRQSIHRDSETLQETTKDLEIAKLKREIEELKSRLPG